MMKTLSALALGSLLLATAWTTPVRADDAETRANAAVSAILFDQDADEFTSYRINDRGYAEVVFAANTPDEVYSRILDKLKSNPDINGVLAGKGGPSCSRFR